MTGISSTLQLPGLSMSMSIGGGFDALALFGGGAGGCRPRPPHPTCQPPPRHPHHGHHRPPHHECHSHLNYFEKMFGGANCCTGHHPCQPPRCYPQQQQGQGGFGFFMAGIVF